MLGRLDWESSCVFQGSRVRPDLPGPEIFPLFFPPPLDVLWPPQERLGGQFFLCPLHPSKLSLAWRMKNHHVLSTDKRNRSRPVILSRNPLGTPSPTSAAAGFKWREDLEKSDKRGGTERRFSLKATDESLSLLLILEFSLSLVPPAGQGSHLPRSLSSLVPLCHSALGIKKIIPKFSFLHQVLWSEIKAILSANLIFFNGLKSEPAT